MFLPTPCSLPRAKATVMCHQSAAMAPRRRAPQPSPPTGLGHGSRSAPKHAPSTPTGERGRGDRGRKTRVAATHRTAPPTRWREDTGAGGDRPNTEASMARAAEPRAPNRQAAKPKEGRSNQIRPRGPGSGEGTPSRPHAAATGGR
jgi:hypothetical protein